MWEKNQMNTVRILRDLENIKINQTDVKDKTLRKKKLEGKVFQMIQRSVIAMWKMEQWKSPKMNRKKKKNLKKMRVV